MHPEQLYKTQFLEFGEGKVHNRDVYTLVDCLGDLGGLIEIIFFVSLSIMHPISNHSYTLFMIKNLFIAKTKDD